MLDNMNDLQLRQNLSQLFSWMEANCPDGVNWYEKYHFTSREYKRIKNNRENVSMGLLLRLQNDLNISLEKLMTGNID